MKKLLLSVVTMSAIFVSCTKEDANSSNNNEENTEVTTSFSLSGKWNFSTVAEDSKAPYSYTAGFAQLDTQCTDVPDYMEFKNSSTVVYGNADIQNTGCTVTPMTMSYIGTMSSLGSSKVLIKNLVGSGQNVTFYVIKNTSTELSLSTVVQGKTWTYLLTKAQ